MTLIDIKAAALQVLVSGDSYGLEIIDKINQGTNGMMFPPQGRVYPALRELETAGLLESYDGPTMAERGGRPRRYYRITAEGKRVAREQASAINSLFIPALGAVR